ncbi:DUF6585 family protein [Streptomyces beijiangensis]|uniref:Uncharacterized protein n=1 Tax=Streptomyces beijiangensis TaxID=163361 RepID=A0A939F573_9ACTN|nr:DUF6585 family protein [Streptomyces beijiangensis]MBO0512287.1 hypothetical protein [Streptomyces beijiangensis]
MDEPIAGPDEHVTALAEKQRMGGWRMVAANQKGGFRKRWGDARLHLYENGLIVTAPEGGEWVYRWDSTAAVLQNLRSVGGGLQDSTYTLIGADGAALSIGRGTHGLLRREIDRLGVTSYSRGPYVVYEGQWGPEVQKGVAAARWASVLERLRGGETLAFGPIDVDRNGLSMKNETESWSRIKEISTRDGRVSFTGSDGRGVLGVVGIYHVPNLYLLLALVRQLKTG